MAREPYCGDCGHSLEDLPDSALCPGCGKSISAVLVRDPTVRGIGRRWRSNIVLFGLPLVDIAQGPDGDEKIGKARGIIAIGDQAIGWIAIGGMAMGFIAIGGVSIGLASLGGFALGLFALGGGAVGGVACGGGAVGGITVGGGAVGYVAQGGGALGYYARGGGAFGSYVDGATRKDPEAIQFFSQWSWLLGSNPQQVYRLPFWIAAATAALTLLLALPIVFAYIIRPREYEFR